MNIIKTVYYIHGPWRDRSNFCCCVSIMGLTRCYKTTFFTFIVEDGDKLCMKDTNTLASGIHSVHMLPLWWLVFAWFAICVAIVWFHIFSLVCQALVMLWVHWVWGVRIIHAYEQLTVNHTRIWKLFRDHTQTLSFFSFLILLLWVAPGWTKFLQARTFGNKQRCFYRLDALHVAHPTVSRHWRELSAAGELNLILSWSVNGLFTDGVPYHFCELSDAST